MKKSAMRHTQRRGEQSRSKCSICRETKSEVTAFREAFICESCAETARAGRDNTTRALRSKQGADRLLVDKLEGKATHLKPEAQDYAIASGNMMAESVLAPFSEAAIGSGGEVVCPRDAGLVNTLTEPRITALEASNHRTDLVSMLGNEVAAMALDASDSIRAGNSLEKMLAHQLATIHHASMQMVQRANLMEDAGLAAKTLQAAFKGFATYQGGIDALRQLRGCQPQHTVVQHVNVNAGGQAVVGSVDSRGRRPI